MKWKLNITNKNLAMVYCRQERILVSSVRTTIALVASSVGYYNCYAVSNFHVFVINLKSSSLHFLFEEIAQSACAKHTATKRQKLKGLHSFDINYFS